MSAVSIVSEYFPEADADECSRILYGKTGWPSWLYKGEITLREQLQAEKDARKEGKTRCYKCGEAFTFQEEILPFCPDCPDLPYETKDPDPTYETKVPKQ